VCLNKPEDGATHHTQGLTSARGSGKKEVVSQGAGRVNPMKVWGYGTGRAARSEEGVWSAVTPGSQRLLSSEPGEAGSQEFIGRKTWPRICGCECV
jgi:hypothetical protein